MRLANSMRSPLDGPDSDATLAAPQHVAAPIFMVRTLENVLEMDAVEGWGGVVCDQQEVRNCTHGSSPPPLFLFEPERHAALESASR